LECVLLLHDFLDVSAEEGLVVAREFEDLLKGLVKFGLLDLIDVVLVRLTNRVVNKSELFLAQVTTETILELVLHLLNEVPLIESVALFPE
jgi:hypothetical protein